MTKIRLVAAAGAGLAAAAVAGCGSETSAPQRVAATRAAGAGSTVTVVRSPFGPIRADRRRVLCQNVTEFGGVWRVIRADGTTVR